MRWAFRLFLLVLLLGMAAFALKDTVLKGVAERRIQSRTGLTATIGQFHVGLGSATLTLRGFKLYNPPEFGGSALLDIPELFMQLDPAQAVAGKLHFKQLRLHLAEFHLVKNREGRFNVDSFEENPKAQAAGPLAMNGTESGPGFGGIDRLEVTLGQVNYSDLEKPGNNRVFALGLRNEVATNLTSPESVRNWLGTLAFRLAVQEIINRSGGSNGPNMELIIGEPGPER